MTFFRSSPSCGADDAAALGAFHLYDHAILNYQSYFAKQQSVERLSDVFFRSCPFP
jgi:hypothetical protein